MAQYSSIPTAMLFSGILVALFVGSASQTCTSTTPTAHPTRCDKFMMCNQQSLIEMDCPAGLVFNDQKNVCDYKNNVPRCSSDSVDLCERGPCPAGTYCTPSTFGQGYACNNGVAPEPCKYAICGPGNVCQLSSTSFTGYICVKGNGGSTNVNPCNGINCGAGRTCRVNGNSYVCVNTGTTVNPCQGVNCGAGRTCRVNGNSYVCVNTGTPANPCQGVNCGAGRVCRVNGNSYVCANIVVNPCQPNPCNTGTCRLNGNSYICSCPAGRYGVNCQFINGK